MDLDRVSAKVRPRQGWEAVDLGVALAQKHLPSLYKIWLAQTLPVFLLLDILLSNYPGWLLLAFWWLIPLFERPLLHWLSRVLFSEPLTVKDCIRQAPKLAILQIIPSLSWRRLSFTRSTDLPVIQLEGLKGSARSERLRVIHSLENGASSWISIVFLLLEIAIFFAMLALIYLMVPQVYQSDASIFNVFADGIPGYWQQIYLWMAYLSISLIAPFYVACGFSIYINQRTLLESWDIELTFRKLAEKLKRRGKSTGSQLAALALLVSSLLMLPVISPQIQAAEQESLVVEETNAEKPAEIAETKSNAVPDKLTATSVDHQQAKALIEKIQSGTDFHQKKQDYRYRLRTEWTPNKDKESSSAATGSWLFLFSAIAWIVEKGLWVLLFAFLLFLVLRYGKLIKSLNIEKKKPRIKPKTLFGLDVTAESLPDKPWLVAKKLIEQGKHRDGLSLLYRAALVWFIDNSNVHIDEGDTELECLAKLRKTNQPRHFQFIEAITHDWRRLAYAHRQIGEVDLICHCEHWPFKSATSEQNNGEKDAKSGGVISG